MPVFEVSYQPAPPKPRGTWAERKALRIRRNREEFAKRHPCTCLQCLIAAAMKP